MNRKIGMISNMTMMIMIACVSFSCTSIIPAFEIQKCAKACNDKNAYLLKMGSHTFKGNCCECTNGAVIFLDELKTEKKGDPP